MAATLSHNGSTHRAGFYCMYFSQQESGQSTLYEDLIGLTAGEEKAGGGDARREEK